MARPVLIACLVVTLLAASFATAQAAGVRIIISGPKFHAGVPHHGLHRPHHFKHHHVFAPGTVFVVSPSPRWVPGHWAYQWVPRISAYQVWVPGHWAPDGTWIEGHYGTRTVSGGYYRPIWVEGRWAP